MKKIILYIKTAYAAAVGSKLRFFLTWIGFAVGVFLVAAGAIILESYYTATTKEIRIMPDDTFFVSGSDISDSDVSFLLSAYSKQPCIQLDGAATSTLTYFKLTDERSVNVSGTFYGLSAQTDTVAYFDYDYGYRLVELKLAEGRLISKEDIVSNSKVAVIDEFTAELVFGKKSGVVGKRIIMNNNSSYFGIESHADGETPTEPVYFEIIGVIKNNYYVEKGHRDFLDILEKPKGQKEIEVNSTVYVPFNFQEHLGNKTTFQDATCYFLYTSSDKAEFESMKSAVDSFVTQKKNTTISTAIDKELLYEEAIQEIRPIRIGIYVAGAVLILISGLFCMSIMFFSMKERITEIGIRKAYGASALDIFVQFLIENLIITLFSVITAIVLAILIAMKTENYIINNLFLDYEVMITSINILLPILVGVIQCVVFTLIPCIRYSALNVTSALKSE